jgi:hypothetical protein
MFSKHGKDDFREYAPSDSVTKELAAEGPVEKTDCRNEIGDIDYPYSMSQKF